MTEAEVKQFIRDELKRQISAEFAQLEERVTREVDTQSLPITQAVDVLVNRLDGIMVRYGLERAARKDGE